MGIRRQVGNGGSDSFVRSIFVITVSRNGVFEVESLSNRRKVVVWRKISRIPVVVEDVHFSVISECFQNGLALARTGMAGCFGS